MKVIGLMSGTSADGIDAVLTEIAVSSGGPQMRQLGFESVPWPQRDRELIERLIAGRGATRDVSRAGFQLGEKFASAALRVAESSGLAIDEIDLIGSHGQTVWHEVEESGAVQSTLQIGEAAVIAERTGVTTVADFRVTDVAAGGQGAPLIPIFDRLFLRPPAAMGGCRAVQNIGGIGNVSFLPPEGSSAPTVAFDTGPGNVLIDWAAARATDGALQFDRDGELAASGRCADKLVDRWLTHPYYHHSPPKSTGRELFSSSLAEKYCLEAAEAGLSMTDFAATVTELTAASIAESYRLFAPMPVVEMVVCGGGARNPVLLHRIKALADLRCGREVALVRYGDVAGVPGDEDSKEALGFALLAWLAVRGEGGNVPESTGANGVRVLGKITPGRNYRRLKTML
ncbi:MAG: anhydro-N-acetylmuramic acid kinase [Caldilineaceae bacterium]|nr:anhydro-N-acetylmuramic acid kinase [Caldilineaceae bacterium]